jgi:hypothetical protein
MVILEATAARVLHVCAHMRAPDAAEVLADSGLIARFDYAAELTRMLTHAFIAECFATDAGTPAALFMVFRDRRHRGEAGFITTDEWPSIAVAVTRRIRRVVIPICVNAGIRRIAAHSIATYPSAHRWMELLGARREGEAREYGNAGETFLTYAWSAAHLSATNPWVARRGNQSTQSRPHAGPGDQAAVAGSDPHHHDAAPGGGI